MKNEKELRINTNDFLFRVTIGDNLPTILKKGARLETRVNNRSMATVALLTWCGAMSFIGSIFLAINDIGMVFTGTLVGGGLIIVAVFTNVTDIYLIWSEPREEKTDAEKGLDALFDNRDECKLEDDPVV